MTTARGLIGVALVLAGIAAAPVAAAAWDSGTSTRRFTVGAPPWYRGEAVRTEIVHVASVRPARVPEGQPEGWHPHAALAALAERVEAKLAGYRLLRPIALEEPPKGGPAIYLGCALEFDQFDLCDRDQREMALAVTHPAKRWREAVAAQAKAAGATHVLIVELAVADHWLTQKDFAGRKEIRLGVDRALPVPWLTSLDTPVGVVQLTGMLLDADGRVLRGGAEGVYAVPTKFSESVLGLQRLVRSEDVAAALAADEEARRPGEPLQWERALEALVAGLLGA